MKAIRVVAPLVLAGVIVLVVTMRMAARSELETYRLQREALRLEMVERSVVARGAAGPAGLEEARAVLRWWDDASASLRRRFPGPARASAPARPAASRADPKGGRRAAQGTEGQGMADPGAWFAYADERAEALRAGYAPVLSGTDQGLRIDLLAVRAGEHPDTHERALRIDFAVWGAPRRIDREPGPGGGEARATQRVVVPLSFRQLGFRFMDAAGKTYGEMTGSGEPYLVLKDPERFSAQLPPGIAFGTWWVDPFPREAARVELAVALQVQGTGAASLTPAFRWELPVPDEWKLRPGEAFRAETREAPAEAPPAR